MDENEYVKVIFWNKSGEKKEILLSLSWLLVNVWCSFNDSPFNALPSDVVSQKSPVNHHAAAGIWQNVSLKQSK